MSDAPSFHIRPARTGDEATIGNLSQLASTAGAPAWATIHSIEDEIAWARSAIASADPSTALLVAVDAGEQVLGFVTVIPVTDVSGHRHAPVSSIAVAPEAEGRGIGTALLTTAEAWCREQGFSDVTLHVYPGNPRARQVYERAGFEIEWHRLRKELG